MLIARGTRDCDVYIKNSTIINVYTGELWPANIAIKDKHIAYVGSSDAMVSQKTRVIDATGQYLCPGYIEPHAHPFQNYNPVNLAQKVMIWGTTVLICDNLFFFMRMDEDDLMDLWRDLARLPVKLLWSVRLDPQTHSLHPPDRFAPAIIEKLLHTPLARQVGELTDWPSLLAGDQQMLDNIVTARRLGKRVEGHLPGASLTTINAMAAGGVTACHESIKGEEALNRLRLGLYVSLRHSSLRPDLPGLLQDLLAAKVDLRRAMLTTDGVTTPYLKHGFTDHLIRLALEAGVPYMEAYRMATLNPAVYYGLDDELGGIAPGKIADLLFLEDPLNPTPLKVIINGQEVFTRGQEPVQLPPVDWQAYNIASLASFPGQIRTEYMVPLARDGDYPVMELANPVITRRKDRPLPTCDGYINLDAEPGLVYAALLSLTGQWVCNGVLSGFARTLEGLACSGTITGDILALGREPREMQRAVERVFALGGGVVLAEDGHIIYELALPLGGTMSQAPLEELIEQGTQLYNLLAQRGHEHYDLFYTLLFMSATHLPEIRLSPGGLYAVKERSVIIPARRIGTGF